MKKVFLLGLLLPLTGVSQKLENLEAVAEGNKIVFTYDISGGFTGDTYDVSLYASHNNFLTPLQRVTGNIGKSLSDGKGKRIEWDGKSELGNFRGDLSFEVRVEVRPALALLHKMSDVKRGKNIELVWRGGSKQQDVKIELLKSGANMGTIGIVPNIGSYKWELPSHQPVGSDFQLRLVIGSESVVTEPFAIRHKVPTVLKAAPLALLVMFALPGSSATSADTQRTPAKVTATTLN